VLSFTQGVSTPTATTGGGGAGGRAIFSGLTVSKPLDKATPLLYQNCAAATPIASAVLTLCQAGGDQNEIYRITLRDLVITSVQTGGASGADLATESVTLSFSRIEWRYVPYDATGKPGTPVVGSWNIPANTP